MIEIDQVSLTTAKLERLRARDPVAIEEMKAYLRDWYGDGSPMVLYSHALYDPPNDAEITLRELEELGVIWGVEVLVDPQ